MKTGLIHKQVKLLQQYLNTHGFILTKTGAGSPGKETEKFGALTRTTLIKFQKAKKLTPDGVVGPKTRAYINSHK